MRQFLDNILDMQEEKIIKKKPLTELKIQEDLEAKCFGASKCVIAVLNSVKEGAYK